MLRDEFLPPGGKNQPEGGSPEKTDSEAKVAERLRVPPQTINEAKQHSHFPELEKHPIITGGVRTINIFNSKGL